jgi:hypothetical protein
MLPPLAEGAGGRRDSLSLGLTQPLPSRETNLIGNYAVECASLAWLLADPSRERAMISCYNQVSIQIAKR